MKKFVWILSVVAVFALTLVIVGNFYSYIFAKEITGEILSVEKVGPQTVVSADKTIAFSFGVAIRLKSGEIYTASSEDRQWAVAKQGLCVDAKIFPYPPWDMEKSGAYHNARLVKLSDCK